MKKLVPHAVYVLGLAMTGACDPVAQAYCDKRVECGSFADAETCLESLRGGDDNSPCIDEAYEMIECAAGLEYTCGDYARVFAESCSVHECEARACSSAGEPAWRQLRANPCRGEPLDPTGRWVLKFTAVASPCVGASLYRTISVERSGDGFTFLSKNNGAVSTTGTLDAMGDTAIMRASVVSRRTDDSEILDETYTFDATAKQLVEPTPSSAADITGTGTYVVNGCSGQVTLTGTLEYYVEPDEDED